MVTRSTLRQLPMAETRLSCLWHGLDVDRIFEPRFHFTVIPTAPRKAFSLSRNWPDEARCCMQPWKSSAESPESQSISEGHIGRSDTTTSISLRAGFDASDDENLQRGTSSREDDRLRHLKR